MNRTPIIAWTAALISLGLGWLALTALTFGPGMASISRWLVLSGFAFTTASIYVRRRWGGLALAGFFVVAVVGLAAAQGGALAESMDLFEYRRGAIAALVMLTPSLGSVALALHRLAKRRSPILQRDFPIGLAVFGVAQVIGVGLALAVASLAIPIIRH